MEDRALCDIHGKSCEFFTIQMPVSWDLNLFIIEPEDESGISNARPSAGTVLTTKLDIFP